MPNDAEQAFRDAFDAFQDTPPTMGNHNRPYQAAAAVIERAIAEAVEQERARIARALRLYPEWCRNWGLDRNMKVATQAANECADMLAHMPAELPEDDDDAAKAIYTRLPDWIEANARANALRGDHKELIARLRDGDTFTNGVTGQVRTTETLIAAADRLAKAEALAEALRELQRLADDTQGEGWVAHKAAAALRAWEE